MSKKDKIKLTNTTIDMQENGNIIELVFSTNDSIVRELALSVPESAKLRKFMKNTEKTLALKSLGDSTC